ncbi:MAG: helix-turn-helix transcriptional regulator [Lachnospiraceae bacterium]|nr:helix-turn-helix transcriptional regulator [Lachnospiraceae bacterium]
MLSLKINEILEQQGRTPYWLGKQTGISQNNIGKICNGETSTIRFDTLEKICIALDCSINDLFTTDNQQLKRLLTYQSKLSELQNKE